MGSSNSRVRLGVLGAADIAWRRTLPAMMTVPAVELVAVSSRSAEKARRFADAFGAEPYTDHDALLARADLDAVYLPLPTGLHATWARRALAAGKHVFCEKPLSVTHAEAAALVDQADRAGLRLMENFMFLHHSQHDAVRRTVAGGELGELRTFRSVFGIPPLPADDVRYDSSLGGGALLDVGVYPIRAAQMFLGDRIEVVGAVLRHDPCLGVDLSGSALLVDENGTTAELSFGFTHAYRSAYELWGSAARLELDRAFTPPQTHQPELRIHRPDGTERRRLAADHQFANAAAAFASAVLDGGAPTVCEGEHILRRAQLVDRIRTAAGVRSESLRQAVS